MNIEERLPTEVYGYWLTGAPEKILELSASYLNKEGEVMCSSITVIAAAHHFWHISGDVDNR